MVPEGAGVSGGHKEVKPCWNKEGYDMLEVSFFYEAPPGLRAPSIEMKHRGSYIRSCMRESNPTLKDVATLMMLPLSGRQIT